MQIRQSKKFWKKKQRLFIIGMLSLALINFAIFWVYVNIQSIVMAFQDPGTGAFSFINFKTLFDALGHGRPLVDNPQVFSVDAIVNTLIFFAVSLFFITPVSFVFSYFLYKKIWGYKVFRVVFFLPSIISVVVLTSLFGYMFSTKGIVTEIFMWLTGSETTPIFFGEERYALTCLILYNIWTGFGTNIILFSGAMSRIPEELMEYNKLEGVGFARELVQFVAPLIWPTFSTVIIFACVGIFNASGPILFFTTGNFRTNTISYWIFAQVYQAGGIPEYAAAVGLFFTAIGVPFVMVVKWLLGKVGQDVEY